MNSATTNAWTGSQLAPLRHPPAAPVHVAVPAPAVSDRVAPPAGRLQFETLMSDLSALLLAAPAEEVESAIEATLHNVRICFSAERSLLLKVSADETFAGVASGAYADGLPVIPGTLNLVELFPWALQQLLEKRLPVKVHRMTDVPLEAAVDRSSWNQHAPMRSSLAVPLCDGRKVRHVIALHWVTQECHFPDVYVPRLRVLGEMMVNALGRKQAVDVLRQSEKRLARAASAAGCGLWELDVRSGGFWLTSEMRQLHGFEPEELVTWERLLGVIHPADTDTLVAAVNGVMNGNDGLDERYRIVRADGAVRWLRVTARRGTATRLEGAAFDVTESIEIEGRLRDAVDEVGTLRHRLERENSHLRREAFPSGRSELIVGRSPAIQETLALARQVANTTANVLLLGATGTGKERFASFIHDASGRHGRPMIRVNCSAIPSGLIESELFGREKGAYTGAMSKQIGRFELAHGSTLFLDEIGELPPDVQVKLLRVLEERTIERLGSPRPIAVDVRIIAATNRNLEQVVREGGFRADLFYRLNVFPIVVPALRDRREDIPALVTALMEEIGAAMGKRFDGVGKVTLAHLQRCDWPGNVRELRNILERAMILCPGPILHVDPADAPELASRTGGASTDALEDVERTHILRVLAESEWRIKGADSASSRLRMKPSTLRSRMKKLDIARPA